jgi:DNA polymerase-3 subunit alpha
MSLDELTARLKDIGQTAVAITEPGHMISMVAAYETLTKAGIKPILGLEAQWSPDAQAVAPDDLGYFYYPITLLAQNNSGLKNLMTLSTASWIDGLLPDDKSPAARCDFNLLSQFSPDVICLTGNHYGFLAQALTKGRLKQAREWLLELKEIFEDRLYIQVPIPQTTKDTRLARSLIELGEAEGISCVVAGVVYYAKAQDRALHEQKMATTLNKSLSFQGTDGLDVEKRVASSMLKLQLDYDAHIMTEIEVDQYLISNDFDYDLIETCQTIADRIDSNSYFSDRHNRYPRFQNLPEGKTAHETLISIAQWSLYEKFDNQLPPQEYRDRLDYELKVIKRMGYSDYMLIVWEYLEGIKKASIIIGPGRGSAAGSLVAYALDITRLDPIKYGLIFERWLNIGRSATPLIFSQDMV